MIIAWLHELQYDFFFLEVWLDCSACHVVHYIELWHEFSSCKIFDDVLKGVDIGGVSCICHWCCKDIVDCPIIEDEQDSFAVD
jgi:hypothetical protein